MTCREIPASVRQNARSLEELYTGVGVMTQPGGSAGTAATPLAAPRTFLPPGTAASAFPYLTGADGRSFNLAPLYANNREALNCLLTSSGYDEARARAIDTEANATDGEEAYQAYVANLSAQDARTYSIFKTMRVIEFFRRDFNAADPAVGGNKDGNADVISADEVENWAWEFTRHDEATYARFGGDAIARMHSLLGIAQYLATEPPAPPVVAPIIRPAAIATSGTGIRLEAPTGGWQAGDQIFVNNAPLTPLIAPLGTAAVDVTADRLSVGANTVEVRRTAPRALERLSVTVNAAAPAPAPETVAPATHWYDQYGGYKTWAAVGGFAAAALTVFGIRRAVRSRNAAETRANETGTKLREAEARAAELREQVAAREALVGRARSELRPARGADTSAMETRLNELRDQLADKQGELEAVRLEIGGLKGSAGNAMRSARTNFEAAETRMERAQEAVNEKLADRVPDHDAGLASARAELENAGAAYETARGELVNAARGKAANGEAAARAQRAEQWSAERQRIRTEMRALEAQIRGVESQLAAVRGGQNAFDLLEGGAPRTP